MFQGDIGPINGTHHFLAGAVKTRPDDITSYNTRRPTLCELVSALLFKHRAKNCSALFHVDDPHSSLTVDVERSVRVSGGERWRSIAVA